MQALLKDRRTIWFLGFTAIFAVLVGFVFWGTWSTDFAPVMPDDTFNHSLAYGDILSSWFRRFWATGKVHPGDLLWSGLLFSPYFCQELKYASALFFAALGLVYFLRGRGLSYLASYGAGLLLAFCGYWSTLFSAGHGGWFIWMTYGIWPLGLIDRALDKGRLRHWLLLGATIAWGCFNQSDLWLLFTVFTGLYFCWRCWETRQFPWRGALLAGAALFLIGAPGFYSALVNDLAGRDQQIAEGQTVAAGAAQNDAEKRWIFVTNWSLPPAETLEFIVPRVNGDTSCPMTLSMGMRRGTGVRPYTGALGRPKDAPAGNYRQHSLYVGFVTCLLALLAVVSAFVGLRQSNAPTAKCSRSSIFFFALAAFVFCLFSFGRYCEPVYRLVYALPFGDYLRAPVKWHHLTELCLCVLAGFGIDALVKLLVRLRCPARGVPYLAGALIVWGAINLAQTDHLYCAPVDLREAKRQNCDLRMTFLQRSHFANPQVAAMVKAKRIVALAQPNAETYLVGVLEPRAPRTSKPLPPMQLPTWLGLISLFSSLGVVAASAISLGGSGNRQ